MNNKTDQEYARVICHGVDPEIGMTGCGPVLLTYQEYDRQMNNPNATWRCPRCRGDASFDDEYWENRHLTPEERS